MTEVNLWKKCLYKKTAKSTGIWINTNLPKFFSKCQIMARNNNDHTGLLTRCVPEKLKHSALYRWFLRFTRVLQFLSSIISLAIFSKRIYKVYRLVNTIKQRHGVNHSYGAVEGILAAAVLYTLISMLLSFILRGRGSKWLRRLWVLFDLLFVGAFIAVAVLTRPSGGSAGPRHCYNTRDSDRTTTGNQRTSRQDDSCNLPWGTFILAIISTYVTQTLKPCSKTSTYNCTASFTQSQQRFTKYVITTGRDWRLSMRAPMEHTKSPSAAWIHIRATAM